MIVNVKMLAFGDQNTIRQVVIPDSLADKPIEQQLEQVWYWGQNENIALPLPSVSVGDVVVLHNRYFLAKPVGFEELLTEDQLEEYANKTQQERGMSAYAMPKIVQAQDSQRQTLEKLLRDNGLDPDQQLESGQSAFEKLEAAIMGAFDEIEEQTA